MDIVEFLKPKYVLMENVVDILKFDKASLGRYALSRLVHMKYQARFGIIAAGCYGLPQFRLRVFIWGADPSEVRLLVLFTKIRWWNLYGWCDFYVFAYLEINQYISFLKYWSNTLLNMKKQIIVSAIEIFSYLSEMFCLTEILICFCSGPKRT